MLERARGEQTVHIAKLEQVREQQKSHIDLLVREISELRVENEQLLDEKENLQKDMQVGTDYCV